MNIKHLNGVKWQKQAQVVHGAYRRTGDIPMLLKPGTVAASNGINVNSNALPVSNAVSTGRTYAAFPVYKGKGIRGHKKLAKGSREAKAHMAHLRNLRRRKHGM